MSDKRKPLAPATGSACRCGCEDFVWWISEQQCYSSPTWGRYYDHSKHRDAHCSRCNSHWPNRELSHGDAGGAKS